MYHINIPAGWCTTHLLFYQAERSVYRALAPLKLFSCPSTPLNSATGLCQWYLFPQDNQYLLPLPLSTKFALLFCATMNKKSVSSSLVSSEVVHCGPSQGGRFCFFQAVVSTSQLQPSCKQSKLKSPFHLSLKLKERLKLLHIKEVTMIRSFGS